MAGISGGQKRRVTVGEMLLDKSCEFICLENITDGLSSTDSVHLIQGLAKVSRTLRDLDPATRQPTLTSVAVHTYRRPATRAGSRPASPSSSPPTKW